MNENKIKKIYTYASQIQQAFTQNLNFLKNSNNYRAPGIYHLTAEQFQKAVVEADTDMKRMTFISFIAQAVVETSTRQTNKINKVIKWIEKKVAADTKIREEVQKAAIRNGQDRIQPVRLNRRQRRRMQRSK